MGSTNAFVQGTINLESNALRQTDHAERPVKRIRLSQDAFAVNQTRSAHEATSLEVDHMILDYVAWHTINACLASRDLKQQSRSSKSLSASLSMSDTFLPIFKSRHPSYTADPELKFRIKLLKLVTLFTQRLTFNPTTPSETSLESLRSTNIYRARNWIKDMPTTPSSSINVPELIGGLPISEQDLERNRRLALQKLRIPAEGVENEEAFYGTSSCISLLDLLPLFMEISAARNAMSASKLSERSMDLASEFMLQACLEQYLAVGAHGTGVIDEAFAWGYENEPQTNTQCNTEVNEMFEDEEYAMEVDSWSRIKRSHLERLVPSEQTRTVNVNFTQDIVLHLENVAAQFPVATFEASMLAYLDALSKSIPRPLLVQLESGKLDGLSENETQDFLTECGVDIAALLGT